MYAIGLDFGTLSGRAVLVDVGDGAEIAEAVFEYPHAVMDSQLPSGAKLPPDWALQHPQDYLDALAHTIPALFEQSAAKPEDVKGIAIDFTASSPMPTQSDGTPLCFLDEFKDEPHAYIKLWKHHAAQRQADQINAVASDRGETWLPRYGGKISSEWLFSKLLQILQERPDIYERTDRFIEAADWVIWQLTGVETRSACIAGYKAMVQDGGFPSKAYFKALDPAFEHVVDEKMTREFAELGAKAGQLTPQMAKRIGLPAGIAVAVANVDAHVTAPAVKATDPGAMVMIMGTSGCHIMSAAALKEVDEAPFGDPAAAPGPEDDYRVDDGAQDRAVNQLADEMRPFGHSAGGDGGGGAGKGELEEEVHQCFALAWSGARNAAEEKLDLTEDGTADAGLGIISAIGNPIADDKEYNGRDAGVHEVLGQ